MSDPRVSRQSDRCPNVTTATELWNTATTTLDRIDALQVGDRCFVEDTKTMYMCTLAPLTMTATWVAAYGSAAPSVQVQPLLVAIATVVGTTGAIAPGSLITWNGLDIVIGDDPAYTPSSGLYDLPVTGADAPAGAYVDFAPLVNGGLCAAQSFSAGAMHYTIVDPAGAAYEPGSFVVKLYAPTP